MTFEAGPQLAGLLLELLEAGSLMTIIHWNPRPTQVETELGGRILLISLCILSIIVSSWTTDCKNLATSVSVMECIVDLLDSILLDKYPS